MAEKIKFSINSNNFSDFISKLDDLTKISNTIKLKIDADHILMYSTLGESVMLAFKSYLINTNEYLNSKNDIDKTIDLVISNAKKFVKNLEFLKNNDKITIDLSCKESSDDDSIMNVRSLQIVGGKLKVNWLGTEAHEIRDINKDILNKRLDIKNRKWFFTISRNEFLDIKKLSNINEQKIINISVNNGKVIVSETNAWELELSDIEQISADLIFNKKFLSCIDDLEIIEFSMFETFILIKYDNTNLMLSYEQDFNEDD